MKRILSKETCLLKNIIFCIETTFLQCNFKFTNMFSVINQYTIFTIKRLRVHDSAKFSLRKTSF